LELSVPGLDDGEEIPNLAAEVGQRSLSDRLYWECKNSMTFSWRNRRGNFGSALRDKNAGVIFSKIGQVSSARLNK
jgi:hypothetical protein